MNKIGLPDSFQNFHGFNIAADSQAAMREGMGTDKIPRKRLYEACLRERIQAEKPFESQVSYNNA
ncbi:succinylglutamate desuccinylase/aspartoacylase family protein [Chlorobium limicola]|uniref:succinylglutamate desuccinylase/aspartoacylase family protein n=1 Tax=Chlorobium limicola TaxID=1092 RepID=UPI001232B6D0|nr:succinylglutamate desuccinylase/aspartoacylase family protein [Chlorobium limicola]